MLDLNLSILSPPSSSLSPSLLSPPGGHKKRSAAAQSDEFSSLSIAALTVNEGCGLARLGLGNTSCAAGFLVTDRLVTGLEGGGTAIVIGEEEKDQERPAGGVIEATVEEVEATEGVMEATVDDMEATGAVMEATVDDIEATGAVMEATVEVEATGGAVEATVEEVEATGGAVEATGEDWGGILFILTVVFLILSSRKITLHLPEER